MARKPFRRKSCKAWYVWHQGKQVRLHEDYDKAIQKWHELMAKGEEPEDSDRKVGDIINDFLEWTTAKRAPRTSDWYYGYLMCPVRSFNAAAGQLKVSDLKPYHVTRWIDARGYTGTTANGAIRAVMRCLNWAVKEGYIDRNPIKGIEKPKATARECYISPEQFKTILANTRGQFREFLVFARATGARPQEIRAIEARHFDRKLKAIVFPREESKGKRTQRVIPLTPKAFAIIERLVERWPTGKLFRNSKDRPWTTFAITCACRRLSEKVGFHVIAYAIRHTFATDALVNGVDPITVANMMGHKDLKMLMETYSKIQVRQDHMQAAIMKAVGDMGV